MPRVTTTEKLIELIKRSGLVSKEDLAAFLGRLARKAGGVLPASPNALADEFVQAGMVTEWQVEQLLKGKYRGFRLGKYTLKGHLGTGGMSSVYLSEHPIMRRPVAIKVLPKTRVSKSSYLERFELEARAVAALDHPNIVRAYDIDNEGDTHYIVMEYVEGRDLQRIVEQEGPLSYERAADYIAQAAVGLQHAHEAGVVHRDIKPANCLVDKGGTVKVLDMGLAKFSADENSLSAMHKDSVVGHRRLSGSGTGGQQQPSRFAGRCLRFGRHALFPADRSSAVSSGHVDRTFAEASERGAGQHLRRPTRCPARPGRYLPSHDDEEGRRPDSDGRRRGHRTAALAQRPRLRRGREFPWRCRPSDGRCAGPRRRAANRASDRFRQMSTTPPPRLTRPDRSSDTVSASGTDTRRMQSEDDLTLAPLDDDKDAQDRFGCG